MLQLIAYFYFKKMNNPNISQRNAMCTSACTPPRHDVRMVKIHYTSLQHIIFCQIVLHHYCSVSYSGAACPRGQPSATPCSPRGARAVHSSSRGGSVRKISHGYFQQLLKLEWFVDNVAMSSYLYVSADLEKVCASSFDCH